MQPVANLYRTYGGGGPSARRVSRPSSLARVLLMIGICCPGYHGEAFRSDLSNVG